MGSNRFKHNKKRNSGLIYEFLVRKMSQSLLEKDSKSYGKALNIIKKYYSAGRPLAKEKEIFDVIIPSSGLKESVARGMLNEVVSVAKKLDHRLIDIKKSNVIKEIHKNFGKSFFNDYRVSDYKAYASTQILIGSCSGNTLNESVQKIEIEDALLNYMTRKQSSISESKDKADNLIYSIAVKKFNERYNSILNEEQKKLLKNYMSLISNGSDSKIINLCESERKVILERLKKNSSIRELNEDKEMGSKFLDCELALHSMKFSGTCAEQVEDLMLYHKLVEELESND